MKETEKEVRHYLPMCYFQLDENGLSPQQCYYLYDTYGKKVLTDFKCKDPITVQRIIWGKQLTNMTIKMWSDDIKGNNREGWQLLTKEELTETLKEMPSWVKKSLDNSLRKR